MKKRNQNDAMVKMISIKTEKHFFSLLNYAEKENHSEQLTSIREDDMLEGINAHRQIEYINTQNAKGGRPPNFAKQIIISFPKEYKKEIDLLSEDEKKSMIKKLMMAYLKRIVKDYPDLDLQFLANMIEAQIHNDTDFTHFHLMQLNIAKTKDGNYKRIDLSRRAYSYSLKKELFKIMRDLKPDNVEELTREKLNELRKVAATGNNKYANTWKAKIKNLNPDVIAEHSKFTKRLDKKLSQFSKYAKSDKLSEAQGREAFIQFYKDIEEIIQKSHNEEVKNVYSEVLNDIKDGAIKEKRFNL